MQVEGEGARGPSTSARRGPGDVFSNHDGHTNRLIPDPHLRPQDRPRRRHGQPIASYRDDGEGLRKLYGFLPENTRSTPTPTYADQSDLRGVHEAGAVDRGVKHLFIVWFDGMDWETDPRGGPGEVRGRSTTPGDGSGLTFQEDRAGRPAQFGYYVTAPTHDWKAADVDNQTPPIWLPGGYDATIAGPNPWTLGPLGPAAPGYLRGLDASPAERRAIRAAGRVLHPYTDSAPSAGEFATGVKSYNHGINVGEDGKAEPTLFNQLQEQKGWKVGTVTSVPFDHASPAAFYAHNVYRDDYQDLARDMLGLPGIAQEKLKDPAHPGLDVILGAGFGHEAKPADLAKAGKNAAKGNLFLAADDLKAIDARGGGKYVVAMRTPGVGGHEGLATAAEKAARDGKRLFGFYGSKEEDHLPYRTADGDYQPAPGLRGKAETYDPADLRENPTLADMTAAALTVLAAEPGKPFALFVEAGDVDFALHDNNLDNAIGAVLSGDEAVRVVFDWVETHSNWDDSAVIVTADHGHYLVLDDPKALAGHAR